MSSKLKPYLPSSSALRETLGIAIAGVGLFLLLSLVSYSPEDKFGLSLSETEIHNKAGPLGAWISEFLLKWIGLVSLLWALLFLVVGTSLILGFAKGLKLKRIPGALFVTIILAGFAHIRLLAYDATHLEFGFGGVIGGGIGQALLNSVGPGGAWIVLVLAGLAGLVLTGNLRPSHTADLVRYIPYFFKSVLATPRAEKRSRRADDRGAATPAKAKSTKPKNKKAQAEISVEEDTGSFIRMTLGSPAPKSERPDLKSFKTSEGTHQVPGNFVEELKARLEAQLKEFKVSGEITNVTRGPVVTTIEYIPDPGVKSSKIVSLEEDLARLLKAKSLRVLSPIPGKNTMGFEIPNYQRDVVTFGDIVQSKAYADKDLKLPVTMGADTVGAPVVEDLAEMPHLLIAGATGAGKSVFINTLVGGLICRNPAKSLRFVMIDPKMIELSAYNDLPHLACPVVTDIQTHGKSVLNALVHEMEDRYQRLGWVNARNIQTFNETIKKRKKIEFPQYSGKWQALPYLVVLIDEFADMIMVLGNEAETSISRLAQKARAAGIHLVIATQRPSVNVVTGSLKANFTTRVAFRVQSGVDSRTILDQVGAERLLGKGDCLYQNSHGTQRLHGAFLSDAEVTQMVKAARG